MLNYIELQQEIYQWKVKNFGGKVKHGHQNMLGVIEEIGELSHSVLKKQQGIRLNENHDEKIEDAIGDIFIFLLNWLSEKNIIIDMPLVFYDDSVCNVDDEINVMEVYMSAYELVHIQLSHETGKIKDNKLSKYETEQFFRQSAKTLIEKLIFFCGCNNLSFETVVLNTWSQVKQRNWKENKINGAE